MFVVIVGRLLVDAPDAIPKSRWSWCTSDPGAESVTMSDTPGRTNAAASGSGHGGPAYHDKVYRSGAGVAGGVVLLVLLLWLCIDAMATGAGRAPAVAASVIVFGVPLIAAFTVWPQVRSGADRMLVRNPFRTIHAPWPTVESLTAALSVELVAGGRKFIVWAIPVSLRQRKRANRRAMIAAGDRGTLSSRGGGGFGGFGGYGRRGEMLDEGPAMATADKAVAELNERAEQARQALADRGGASAPAELRVTWTWPIIVPIVLGVIATIVLIATG
jgi:hypothetical protein